MVMSMCVAWESAQIAGKRASLGLGAAYELAWHMGGRVGLGLCATYEPARPAGRCSVQGLCVRCARCLGQPQASLERCWHPP